MLPDPSLPEIPKPQPITTKCVKLNMELYNSPAMMDAALGTGPQTGKRSWEYILEPKESKP